MSRLKVFLSTLVLSWASGFTTVNPVAAEVFFRWAEISTVVNRVELIGNAHRHLATPPTRLHPGHLLSTDVFSQAELRFNDGSLVRLGEQAQLQFWPTTRKLRLNQGTALLFAVPNQGRTFMETPNAVTGLQNSAAVVRYVQARNLTLVMALANPSTGPVSVTVAANGQEGALYAGQMALINDAGLQIIEFDLQEFYRTSSLVLGLNIVSSTGSEAPDDAIALLRPVLVSAITQQQPFSNGSAILDPALISRPRTDQTLFQWSQDGLLPADAVQQSEATWTPNALPAGVVMPLPELSPSPDLPASPPLPDVEPLGATAKPAIETTPVPATSQIP